jgi:hypothetical protein
MQGWGHKDEYIDFMVLNWKLTYSLSIKNKHLKWDFQMKVNCG